MKYADNNRISHRQLYRQMVLALIAPFLLCAIGWQEIFGADGVLGILLALPLISLYVIFLIRLHGVYENPRHPLGGALRLLIFVFFLAYAVLTGAYLLTVLGEIVPRYLVTGADSRLLMVLSVTVCGLGTFQGMQKRGRMAEVAGGVVAGGVVLLYLLSVSQGSIAHFPQLSSSEVPLHWKNVLASGYGTFCIFSGIGLLPLLLSKVEKPGRAAWPVQKAVWVLGGLLCAGLILLQGAFGEARMRQESYPILPLMAGANLPGDILGRFDVVWMGILLFGLLFSIGSLQHYATHILQSMHLEGVRWWVAVLMLLFSWVWIPGTTLQESYPWLLQYVFCPGFLAAAAFLWLVQRRKKS
ncbi:MAG: GerAB/ArcD/ProY family transporter [Blautia sp.]|jgi:spore germination protein KB